MIEELAIKFVVMGGLALTIFALWTLEVRRARCKPLVRRIAVRPRKGGHAVTTIRLDASRCAHQPADASREDRTRYVSH
jgi:hypothetical protein